MPGPLTTDIVDKIDVSSKATVRRLREEDAGGLQRHCYADTSLEDVQDYVTWCLHPSRQHWIIRLVAEVDGEAVGHAQLTLWGNTGEIGSVVVADAFQRQGLARRLIDALVDEAQARGLAELEIWARQDQPAVVGFYQRLGFVPGETQKNGLSHPACPEPAIRLRMPLRGR
jgi:ribosomal protein S18 acetylase RimI-like enzyme